MTVAIVCYCPRCDYFVKTAVQPPVGTHGCLDCGGAMEVYVAQGSVAETVRFRHVHARPQGEQSDESGTTRDPESRG